MSIAYIQQQSLRVYCHSLLGRIHKEYWSPDRKRILCVANYANLSLLCYILFTNYLVTRLHFRGEKTLPLGHPCRSFCIAYILKWPNIKPCPNIDQQGCAGFCRALTYFHCVPSCLRCDVVACIWSAVQYSRSVLQVYLMSVYALRRDLSQAECHSGGWGLNGPSGQHGLLGEPAGSC